MRKIVIPIGLLVLYLSVFFNIERLDFGETNVIDIQSSIYRCVKFFAGTISNDCKILEIISNKQTFLQLREHPGRQDRWQQLSQN